MSVTVKVESPTRAKLKLLKTQLRLASVDAVIQHLLLEAGHGGEAGAAAGAPAEGEADEDAHKKRTPAAALHVGGTAQLRGLIVILHGAGLGTARLAP